MKRIFLTAVLLMGALAPVAQAAYGRYETARANKLLADVKLGCIGMQDCNFCIDGWHYVQADAWAYFDPITEYTNHYIEACSATGCYHECTAFRDKVTQTVLLITDCFIMAGSCSGCQ